MSENTQILKIGGSILTDKLASEPIFAADNAHRLAREIAGLSHLPVVVHGTGSFGKPPAKRYRYMNGILSRQQAPVISAVSEILEVLRKHVLDAFRNAGVPSVSLSAGSLFAMRNGTIVECNWQPVVAFARNGVLPIISGDFVTDLENDFAVCSSDLIATQLAISSNARRLVLATDVSTIKIPGQKTCTKPQVITQESYSQWKHALTDSADDVSHGMAGKLSAGFLASEHGIETFIVNGTVSGQVFNALTSPEPTATRLISNKATRSAEHKPALVCPEVS